MNFNPPCASYPRFPQPGHRGDNLAGREPACLGLGDAEELLPPGCCQRLEQGDPRRGGHAKPGRAGLGEAVPPARAQLQCSALPFRQRAAPRRGSLRPATPGERPGSRQDTLALRRPDKLPSSRVRWPRRLAGGPVATSSPASRESRLCPLSYPAHPLQQSRRPGLDQARGLAGGLDSGRGGGGGGAGAWRGEPLPYLCPE